MASEKAVPHADIHALAAEVMDLWQEHLAAYASNPEAKAELMRLLEPQRRLFADWAAMMQSSLHGTSAATKEGATRGLGAASSRPTPATAASDDSALRVAQLAHRMAEFEKRLARIESASRTTPAKTLRRTKPN